MSFDLITSESELPGRVGKARDLYELLAPGRSVTSYYTPSTATDSFGRGGQLSFDFTAARGEWIDLQNSALQIDYVLYKSSSPADTQLTLADQIAPALFTPSACFKSASFYINGTKIEAVTDQYAACSTYLERTLRPKAWLDGVGDSLENTTDVANRIARYSSDAANMAAALTSTLVVNNTSGISVAVATNLVTPVVTPLLTTLTTAAIASLGPEPPSLASNKIRINAPGTYELAVSVHGTQAHRFNTPDPGGPANMIVSAELTDSIDTPISPSFANESVIVLSKTPYIATATLQDSVFSADFSAYVTVTPTQFAAGQRFIELRVTNFMPTAESGPAPTIASNDLVVRVSKLVDTASSVGIPAERVCGQRLIHRPPLSIWYPAAETPMLPCGSYRLDMDPDVDWQKAAVQSLGVAREPNTDYVVRITNVQLLLHRVYGPPVDNTTYLIPLYSVVCTQRSTASSAGQQRIYFDVHASCQELGVAFRQQEAGSNTLYPPTSFNLPNEADRRVKRLYLEFDGSTKPSQSEISEYKDSVSASFQGFDLTAGRYFEGLAALGGDVEAIGAESLEDQHQRGLLVSYQWPRDASSRATRAYVNFQYAALPALPVNATVLLFERYWAAAQIQIQNSQVIGVTVRDN